MDDTLKNNTINISIGKAEALVLFELLANFYMQPTLDLHDNAERLALVRLHGALESNLVDQFAENYDELLTNARTRLLEQWGNVQR